MLPRPSAHLEWLPLRLSFLAFSSLRIASPARIEAPRKMGPEYLARFFSVAIAPGRAVTQHQRSAHGLMLTERDLPTRAAAFGFLMSPYWPLAVEKPPEATQMLIWTRSGGLFQPSVPEPEA